jgi:hypothetical protein
MIDVSVTARKAHAARFASSFDSAPGPAGFSATRKESAAVLTDKQTRIVEQFARLVMPKARRSVYREAVYARLSGRPGDAAALAACIHAAKGFVELRAMREAGLISNRSRKVGARRDFARRSSCEGVMTQLDAGTEKGKAPFKEPSPYFQARPRRATPCHAKPSLARPDQTTPNHAMPCHAMPCHAMPTTVI